MTESQYHNRPTVADPATRWAAAAAPPVAAADEPGPAGVGQVERHGVDFIPHSERSMRLRDLAGFWAGTNLYFFNFSLGVIAYGFGTPLWLVVVSIIVGNLVSYALVAAGSIPGMRSGVPTLVITRPSFGSEPNRVNCLFSWWLGVAFETVNVVFAVFATVALFRFVGWSQPGTTGTLLALALVYSVSVAVAYLGHATVVFVQRLFAVVLSLVMVVLAAFTFGQVDWSASAIPQPLAGAPLAGATLLTVGVIAQAGLAYMQIPSDYPRYMPAHSSAGGVFWTVLATAGGPAAGLAIFGAVLAAQADLSDPVAGVEPLVPAWVYVLFLAAVIGGSVGNNVITLYSGAFAIQSIGVPVKRYQATLIDASCAIVLILYVLFVAESFLDLLNNLLAVVVVWIGPFAGVWLTDAALRRWHYQVDDLEGRAVPRFRPAGLVAFAAGSTAALLTLNAPIWQGPVSLAWLSGGDLSWLVGPLVAAAVYGMLARRPVRAGDVREKPRT